MAITAKAPRGGLVVEFTARPRVLILRNAEIERFEDTHGSVFALWDGFYGRDTKPTSTAVRDLVALGLVGGGMKDAAAEALIEGLGPDHMTKLYSTAQALLGQAFLPDFVGPGGGEDEGSGEDEDPDTGKKAPAPGGE